MSWQQWGLVLGVMVAGGTLYTLAVSPARESARTEAQVRATLQQHSDAIDALQRQVDADRKTATDRYDALRDRIDAASKETSALRLDMVTIRGQLAVLLERVKERASLTGG